MTNEMIFPARKAQTLWMVINMVARRPLAQLTAYYSDVLDRRLTTGQTLHLLNAQLAFVMTVFPAMSFALRIVCLAWLVGAMLRCRTAML